MDNHRILELLDKYHQHTLTYAEKIELDEWFSSLDHPHQTMNSAEAEQLKNQLLGAFRGYMPAAPTVDSKRGNVLRLMRKHWMAAAVSIGLIFLATAWFLLRQNEDQSGRELAAMEGKTSKPVAQDVSPGDNRAVLILEDGTKIDLDNSDDGSLVDRDGIKAVKVNDSTVQYLPVDAKQQVVVRHTIHTPRGGQYRLSLPDGSLVWLNAAASIRYPVAFTGNERRVEISGEAYFEVAKDASKPFIVSIDGKEEVKVLGTHFNVNAYTDNGPPVVTLLEGSVQVSEQQFNVILKPGQQSAFTAQGFRIKDANLEQVIAWKQGYLDFDNLPLEAVMREISRWYDVDIIYKNTTAPSAVFGGRISKNLPLSKVLQMLKVYGVDAVLENKQLIINKSA